MATPFAESPEHTEVSSWSIAKRLVVAVLLLVMLLLANASAIHGNTLFVVATHVPLLAVYVAAFRAVRGSGITAVGLAEATAVVWWMAARSEHADERAFAILTNWVLWIAVLIGCAAVRALRARE